MATVYSGVIVPKTKQSTAITVSTTTQVLDPLGAFEIVITSSSGADVASLPTPSAYTHKEFDTNGLKKDPKVVVGQLLLITHGTDGGSTFTISYNDMSGAAKTAATQDAGDTLLLIAGTNGYAILENTGFTIG